MRKEAAQRKRPRSQENGKDLPSAHSGFIVGACVVLGNGLHVIARGRHAGHHGLGREGDGGERCMSKLEHKDTSWVTGPK
jgi:hypothetical protein